MTNTKSTKTTYSITLPDGKVATRTTAREYTHVVAVFSPSWDHPEPFWGDIAWAGRADLAEKRAASERARFGAENVRIIPVEG